MSLTRRDFVRMSAAAGSMAAVGALAPRLRADDSKKSAKASPAQRILILGGTGFLGPHVVEAARARGHTLTLFNRGKTNPHLFPDVEKLQGDRNGKLDALKGRTWDAVVDTSGYVPRIVRMSAELLKDSVKHYIFISSISVYAEPIRPGADETAPLATMPDETNEEVKKYYGALKALCEKAAESTMPGRVTNIRPALIVGPMDPTDRFTYWPARVDRGGEVLAPGAPDDPVQFIDVRDLAVFVVRCIENKTLGYFNATGPDRTVTIGELLESCKAASKSDATFTWVPADFLEKHKVSAWEDMPVWVPSTGESAGFHRVKYQKAVQAGMTFRPLMTTVEDTLKWFKGLPKERQEKFKAGIAPDREKEVLEAWKAGK